MQSLTDERSVRLLYRLGCARELILSTRITTIFNIIDAASAGSDFSCNTGIHNFPDRCSPLRDFVVLTRWPYCDSLVSPSSKHHNGGTDEKINFVPFFLIIIRIYMSSIFRAAMIIFQLNAILHDIFQFKVKTFLEGQERYLDLSTLLTSNTGVLYRQIDCYTRSPGLVCCCIGFIQWLQIYQVIL